MVHHLVADAQLAAGDVFQARDSAQQRGFAAARGAHEHHEFAVFDVEVHAPDDVDLAE